VRLHYAGVVDVAASLKRTWHSLGIDPEAIAIAPDGTVRALPTVKSEPVLLAEAETHRSDDLARTSPSTPPTERASLPEVRSRELTLGAVIGEGGMGRVWVAKQAALEREVAVKGLLDRLDDPITRAQLLREARVTGALEHPNIIPIHTLVADDDGAPLMVMKRVEGTSWGEHLDVYHGVPHLEPNLRTLLQVCHAVHFAHARGVLHRDLKPDNVMLGSFGEVYVLDWGIAVATREGTGIPGLPLAADSDGVVGTVQYMAPEMAGGRGADLSEKSDVYLLGGILLRILTGSPPHVAPRVHMALHHAWIGEPPELGPEVPEELAAICRRAMARDPEERPTADGLRRDVEAYLEHRASLELTADAWQQLEEASQRTDPRAAIQESRFGFRQALRAWPANPQAKKGLQSALEAQLTRALVDGELATARTLALEMEATHRGEWLAKIAKVREEQERREAEIAKLEKQSFEADLGQAARVRKGFGIGFGLTFALTCVALDLVDRFATPVTPLLFLFATGGVAFVFAVPALARHRVVFPNRVTRRLGVGLAAKLLGQVILFVALLSFGLEMRPTLALTLFPLASTIAVANALLEPRMFWSALVAFGCALFSLFVPEVVYHCVGVSYAAFFIGGALLRFDDDQR